MPRLLPLLLCGLWCCAVAATVPASVRAQSAASQYAGRPVTEVQLLVENQPTADPQLVDLVEVRPGQPLSMATVRESITKALLASSTNRGRIRNRT